MKMTGFLLLLCAFVAGVFFGIWMDWSVAKSALSGARDLRYDVQPYLQANLEVHPGDSISLRGPAGGKVSGLQMSFVANPNPCVNQNTSPCVIDPKAPVTAHFFNCTGSSGYSCTDPAIQQSPTGGGSGLDGYSSYSYAKAVKVDFANLMGMAPSPGVEPPPGKPIVDVVATNLTKAILSCDTNGTTVLLNDQGKPIPSPMTPASGQSVFWIGNGPFTFCSNGNPNGPYPPSPGGNPLAQCEVNMSGQSFQYVLQSQSCKNPGSFSIKN